MNSLAEGGVVGNFVLGNFVTNNFIKMKSSENQLQQFYTKLKCLKDDSFSMSIFALSTHIACSHGRTSTHFNHNLTGLCVLIDSVIDYRDLR